VIGDLTTAQIIIEDGAYFKGSIEIDRGADKQADKNVSPGTTSRPTTSAAGAGPKSI
jgi:cytoskeletal protein CcmA (bactofilin family)